MLFPQVRAPNTGPSSPPRGPRAGMRGRAMDLIEELSISVRRTKSTGISSEKVHVHLCMTLGILYSWRCLS